MTLADAIYELGIEPSATPDEARRAYLRGIKTRKPETDPEGFRRLREAYELVAGALSNPAEETTPSLEIEWHAEHVDPATPELAALTAKMSTLPCVGTLAVVTRSKSRMVSRST